MMQYIYKDKLKYNPTEMQNKAQEIENQNTFYMQFCKFKIIFSKIMFPLLDVINLQEEKVSLKTLTDNSDNLYQYNEIHDKSPRQLSLIHWPLQKGEQNTNTELIIKSLIKLVSITHLYDSIFCLYYALIEKKKDDNQMSENSKLVDKIVALKQPSLDVGVKNQNKKNLQIQVDKILLDFKCLLRVKIKPVVVKRKEQYTIRLAFQSILFTPDFYEHLNKYIQNSDIINYQFPFQQINGAQKQSYQQMINQISPPNKIVADLEAQYYRSTLTVHDHRYINIFQNFTKFSASGDFFIKTKNEARNKLQFEDQQSKQLTFNFRHSIFNIMYDDFIYNPLFDYIYLTNKKSKYLNFEHFRNIVTKISKIKERKALKPNNILQRYETVSLIFNLKPIFFMEVIQTPCRGQFCQHIEFYQLRNLYHTLCQIQGEEYFICPVCQRRIKDYQVIIIEEAFLVLQILTCHIVNNKNALYDAYLQVDHEQQKVLYSYGSNSFNTHTCQAYHLYQFLIDPLTQYFDPSNLFLLKKKKQFYDK